jgi:spermidine synthase
MKNSDPFLLFIAFFSGLSIMAMEISASRLLAPYYGTSLFVWSNIIGIVLAALSLGYYFGGKFAERRPESEVLLKLIFYSGALFFIVPFAVKPLSSLLDAVTMAGRSGFFSIFVSSMIATAALFSIPLMILGAVSPFIIKLYSLGKPEKVGESAGKIFALSTFGSIMGSYLPTLFFIPNCGTRATINFFALGLIVLGSFGFTGKRKFGFFLAALVFLCGSAFSKIKDDPSLIFQDESSYQYLSVRESETGTLDLMYNEGAGIQSSYDPQRILTGMYYDYFTILPHFFSSEKEKKALILGLAGGTIARELNSFFGGKILIDGVEIDQKVIETAKKYFDLDGSGANVHNMDGRIFLRNKGSAYDLIIVDAYQSEIYIPWTLTTKEFWSEVRSRLGRGGIAAINVNSISRDSALLGSIANTIASVFKFVYITHERDKDWNYIITASERPLDFKNLAVSDDRLLPLAEGFQERTEEISFDPGLAILTDDKAPIELLTDKMAYDFIKNY